MKEDYQKALTLNPVSFNGQSYQEQKEPGTSSHLFFRLQDKFRQIPLLVILYLTKFDDIIWSSFWVIPTITSASLCKPVRGIINYSTSICPFEFGKHGKEGKKYKNTRICIENEKSFLDEIFHSFWRAIVWWKNKKFIKNSRHKL